MKNLSYSVPNECFKLKSEEKGAENGFEGKTYLVPFEKRKYWRFFTTLEIYFIWYQDGYPSHLTEVGLIILKKGLLGGNPSS